jgi:hypothetical protein
VGKPGRRIFENPADPGEYFIETRSPVGWQRTSLNDGAETTTSVMGFDFVSTVLWKSSDVVEIPMTISKRGESKKTLSSMTLSPDGTRMTIRNVQPRKDKTGDTAYEFTLTKGAL